VRTGRCLVTLATAGLLGLAGCAAPVALGPSGPAPDPATPTTDAAGTPSSPGADAALCAVVPIPMVGELIGVGEPVAASGTGPQCTWRAAGSAGAGAEEDGDDDAGPTLQGAVLDASAYHAGRPDALDPWVLSVDDLHGVGDEAFVVRLADGAPTTLYVRDGQRALSLWLDDAQLTPQATEQSLARMASLLLNLA